MLFRGKRPTYFNIFFVACVAILLTRTYYLVMTFSSEFNSWDYSIGSLGILSAYLFFVIANKNYVPLEQAEIDSNKPSMAALIFATLSVIPFIVLICLDFNILTLVFDIVNIIIVFPCVYLSAKSVINKHKNPFRQATKVTNICVLALAFCYAIYEMFFMPFLADYIDIITIICGVVYGLATLIILPTLKKGLEPWEI